MKAKSTCQIDNEHVRVTEWRFAPGASTGWHRHDYDYVITPITGGPFIILDDAGNRSVFIMEPGKSYYRPCGIEHDVVCDGESEQSFVEVELKSREG